MSKKATPKAKTFRSGYARDIMPEILTAEERAGLTVPVANEKGGQEGVVPAAQRQYKARYKAVDLREAEMNMAKRARGEMAPIKNGIDDPNTMRFPDQTRRGVQTVGKTKFDPLGGEFPDGEMPDPQPGDLSAEEQALARAQQVPVVGRATPMISHPFEPGPVGMAPAQTYVSETPEQIYLKQRNRVTLEMQDGTMAMACVDVKQSQYGITILLPLAAEGATFIPKPGSEITVVRGENRWPCYFPGTYFEIPELSLLGLVFVKAEEK